MFTIRYVNAKKYAMSMQKKYAMSIQTVYH